MAGRTGGIWRRLRYLNKWRAIRDALSPDQSAEADAAPETRARFAWRRSPFESAPPVVASPVPAVAKDDPGVALDVFGVEFSKPELDSPKPVVAKAGSKVASPGERKRSHRTKPVASKSPTQSKPAKRQPARQKRKP